LIDVHAHALLPEWIEAMRALAPPHRPFTIAGAPVPAWSKDLHLEVMDRHGIAASILSWPANTTGLSGGSARELARQMNEHFASIVRAHPARFGAFAVVPMDDMSAALDELAYALDVLGLDGLGYSTHVNGAYLGDPRFDDLLAELHRREATLFVHPIVPPDFNFKRIGLNASILEFMFDTTRMAAHLVVSGAKARYSKANIICTHGGGTIPYLAPRIGILEPVYGAGPHRPTLSPEEIQAGLASFYYDITATRASQLDALLQLAPTDRLMMGTDYPMMAEDQIPPGLDAFASYGGLSQSQRTAIASGNALKLFPRLAEARAATTA
jgi:predicted TIM-barrel fold metal-dependent hydrolase